MSAADGLRIGDAERDEAVSALGEHFAAGRLTRTELDERTASAWAARTSADLRPLFADLPVPHPRSTSTASSASSASSAASAGWDLPGGWTPRPAARRRPFPWLVFLVALVVLTAVTHVPWFLLALALWFVLARTRGWARPPWAGHAWSHGYGRHGQHGWHSGHGCGARR